MGRIFVVALLPSALLSSACATGEAHHPRPEPSPASVVTATVHEESLPVVYRASGTVRGRTTTEITSKTTGYIRAVRVRSGDRVAAGQPLVELEANDVRASVARARAALERSNGAKAEAENALAAAEANAKVAKSSYDRAAALLDDKAIPQQQYDEAEARWRTAQAQALMAEARVRSVGSTIEEARAALGEVSATLGYAEIDAPFSGRVLERRADPGALATPGMVLLVISDDGTPRVEAAVDESRAGDVKVGDDANVQIDTLAKPVVGRVGEIVPSVEAASRAFLVKVDLPPDAVGLRPGTFARVGFFVGTRPRLVVPTTAVTAFGALDRVFVVDAGRARLRMITRGESDPPWTEVLSGLAKDERVVDSPPLGLRDGTPVTAAP